MNLYESVDNYITSLADKSESYIEDESPLAFLDKAYQEEESSIANLDEAIQNDEEFYQVLHTAFVQLKEVTIELINRIQTGLALEPTSSEQAILDGKVKRDTFRRGELDKLTLSIKQNVRLYTDLESAGRAFCKNLLDLLSLLYTLLDTIAPLSVAESTEVYNELVIDLQVIAGRIDELNTELDKQGQ